MNKKKTKGSPSPPLAVPPSPSKRQKQETSNSSTSALETNLELERVNKENALLRTKLSLIEVSKATVSYLHNVRNEMQEILEKERKVVLLQRQLDERKIGQLEEDLETLIRNNCDAREAEVTAEMKYSKLKEAMREFTIKVEGKVNSANAKIIELEGKLGEFQKSDCECIELDGDDIPSYNSGGRKALRPAGNQQSSLVHNSSLRDVEKGKKRLEAKEMGSQRRLDEAEGLKQVQDLVELPLGFRQYISTGTFSAAVEYDASSLQAAADPLQRNFGLWSQVKDLQGKHQKTTSMAAEGTRANVEEINLSIGEAGAPANYGDPLVLYNSFLSPNDGQVFSSQESGRTCSSSVGQFYPINPVESKERHQEDLKIKVGNDVFVLTSNPSFFRLN